MNNETANAFTHAPIAHRGIGKTKRKAEPEAAACSEFVIDKGIPVPPRASTPATAYPFGQMQPRDSFFAPCQKAKILRFYAKNWVPLSEIGKKSTNAIT